MKKRLFFCVTFTVILSLSTLALGADGFKVGVIDLQRCLEQSKEGKKVFEVLKKKKAGLQKKLNEKQKELFELRKQLEKQAMMLSMDAQEDKKKTIERKTRDLEYFFKDLNEEMARAQEKEKRRIFKELGAIIKETGSKHNLTLIMEKRAGGVLYIAESADLTEEVIAIYDKTEKEGK